MDFELAGYTGCTLETMRAWRLHRPEVLQIKLEDIMRDFDTTMLVAFRHLGFTERECAVALDVAAGEDINRMDDATLAANTHIHSRAISKWRDLLSPDQIIAFEQRHGDLIASLGYHPSPARL